MKRYPMVVASSRFAWTVRVDVHLAPPKRRDPQELPIAGPPAARQSYSLETFPYNLRDSFYEGGRAGMVTKGIDPLRCAFKGDERVISWGVLFRRQIGRHGTDVVPYLEMACAGPVLPRSGSSVEDSTARWIMRY
jgi:hypothetical protein